MVQVEVSGPVISEGSQKNQMQPTPISQSASPAPKLYCETALETVTSAMAVVGITLPTTGCFRSSEIALLAKMTLPSRSTSKMPAISAPVSCSVPPKSPRFSSDQPRLAMPSANPPSGAGTWPSFVRRVFMENARNLRMIIRSLQLRFLEHLIRSENLNILKGRFSKIELQVMLSHKMEYLSNECNVPPA